MFCFLFCFFYLHLLAFAWFRLVTFFSILLYLQKLYFTTPCSSILVHFFLFFCYIRSEKWPSAKLVLQVLFSVPFFLFSRVSNPKKRAYGMSLSTYPKSNYKNLDKKILNLWSFCGCIYCPHSGCLSGCLSCHLSSLSSSSVNPYDFGVQQKVFIPYRFKYSAQCHLLSQDCVISTLVFFVLFLMF